MKLHPIKSYQQKADLFMQLTYMASAGLNLDHTLDILKQDNKDITPSINEFKSNIKKGHTVGDSGYKAGLFSSIDRSIICAGESSGYLEAAYQRLASYYSTQASYRKQIKSKLQIPIALLVSMLFIQPIPNLVSGTITSTDYLQQTIGTIIQMVLIVYVLLNGAGWMKSIGLARLLYIIQLAIPITSPWLITRQINHFLKSLGLLLASGLSVSEALPLSINTINNQVLRARFSPAIESVNDGNSLAQSLRLVNDMEEMTLQQIQIGEESGRLDQTIQHLSMIQSDSLASEDSFIVEWIPRIIYLVIVICVAYSILSTDSFSSLPS